MNRTKLTPRRLAESAGKLASVVGIAAALAVAAQARAQVQGAQVVAGSATITGGGGSTVITASNNAIINYQAFNIPKGQSVQFIQPGATSRVLNRITGPDPTTIAGSLSANGIVYIANPAGVYFAHGALVDVGGIYAAAGSITNSDFIGNVNRFTQMQGVVENRGTITGGTVALLGARAANFGTIVAPAGVVTLAAGSEVYLSDGDKRVMAKVAPAASAEAGAAVTNAGKIAAPGGRVALGAGDMYALAIDQRGGINAREVSIRGGRGGVVSVSGSVSAAGTAPGERGGTIEVLGDKVGLFGGTLDASGRAGGGEVFVGGSLQGQGPLPSATATYISPDSTVRADAIEAGHGGTVIVWGDLSTRVYGTLSARGGASAGDGGFIETSGGWIDVRGTPDLRAPRGRGGHWLIDPHDLDITANATTGSVTSGPGVFTATGGNAELNVTDLVNALLGGASVTVQTGAGGDPGDGRLRLQTALDFDGVGDASLTMIAHTDLEINAPIFDGVAGGDSLNLTLTANSDANGTGAVFLNAPISLAGGSFEASGTGIFLGGTLSAGAGDVLFSDPVTLTADSTVSGNDITFAATIETDGTAWTLDLNSAGAGITRFNGRVGDTSDLGALTTNADGSTVINTDVMKAAAFSFGDAVEVATAATITATGSVAFSSTLDSEADEATSLTVAGASVVFGGDVGAAAGGALGMLTTNAPATINAPQMKAGILAFNGDVVLGVDSALTTVGGTTFGAKLDSEADEANSLTTSGAVTFAGDVGTSAGGVTTLGALGTLTANNGATINAAAVRAGAMIFGGATVIDTATTLTGASAVFNGTLNSAAGENNDLLLATTTVDFNGVVGATRALGTLSASGAAAINTSAMSAAVFDFAGAVTVKTNSTLAATTSATFQSTLDCEQNLGRNFTINSPLTTFGGRVGFLDSNSGFVTFTTDAAGTTNVNTDRMKAASLVLNDDVVVGVDSIFIGSTLVSLGRVDSAAGLARNLTINSPATVLGGDVGNGAGGVLGTLSTNAAGTTTIDAAVVRAATLDFQDAVIVARDTALTGATTFASTVDSEAGEANDLGITGAATFNGVVGGGAGGALGTLATGGGTATINTAALNAATMQFGAAVLETSTTLNGNAVTFGSTLDSAATEANSLTINSGTLAFGGVVGGALNGALGTLSASGATAVGTTAITADTLDFAGAVTINANATLTGSTAVTFQSILDGEAGQGRSLTINSPLTTFGGEVGFAGANTGFSTLTTDAAGTTTINAPRVKATNITFNDAVLVGADTILAAGGGAVQFLGTLDSTGGARNLTVNATTTDFTQAVGGVGAFGTLTTATGGTATLGTATVNADVFNFQGNVLLGTDLVLTGTSVTFGGNVNGSGGVRDLTVNAATTVFGGKVGDTTALGTLLTDAPGTTTLGGDIFASVVDIRDNALISGAAGLSATSVTFAGTVNSGGTPGALTITSPVTLFGGSVGNIAPLASLTTDTAGSTRFNGAVLAAAGAVNLQDDVILGSDLAVSGGTVTFAKTINNATATARALTVNAAGATVFGGLVGNGGALASLTTDGLGSSTINAASINVAGALSFQDDVLIAANTTLSGASVAFGKRVNSSGAPPRNLTINSPATSFAGAVGDASALGAIVTDAAGTTTLGPSVAAATMQFNDALVVNGTTLAGTSVLFGSGVTGSALTVNAGATIAGGSVSTTGDQVYGGAVLLGANTVISGNDISFLGTLDSQGAARTLTVNSSGSGVSRFAGAVGGSLLLASLTTNGDGSTVLDAGVNATSMTFNDSVILGSSVAITGASATFGGAVASEAGESNSLTVNSLATTFAGAVGDGAGVLGTLTTGAGTTATINGGSVAAANLLFSGDVLLGADTTLAGANSATFNALLAGQGGPGRSVTINSAATSFNGTFGSGAGRLAGLTTDAAGTTTINTAAVEANAINFHDAVILATTSTVSGSSVAFNGTLDSAAGLGNSLTVNSPGTHFGGAVGLGAGGALGTLTTDEPGVTSIDAPVIAGTLHIGDALVFGGGSITTSGDQTYGGVVTLSADTTLAGHNIVFGSAVDSAFAARSLVVNTSGGGTTHFGGAVGGSVALASLTTNADGLTTVQSGVTAGSIEFLDPVRLDGDSTMTGIGVVFRSTLDSGAGLHSSLTVNATNTRFEGAVGGAPGGELGQLATDASGITTIAGGLMQAQGMSFADSLSLAASTVLAADAITFGAAVVSDGDDISLSASAASLTLGGGTVTTSGDQTYAGGVTLGADTTLTGRNLLLSGTVNSDSGGTPRDLTLNASGASTLAGVLGGNDLSPGFALGTLTVNGVARLAAEVTTSGNMFFGGDVRVLGDSVLRDGGASGIRFSSTIDSEGAPSALTLILTNPGTPTLSNPNVPRISLGGDIGSTLALSSLTLGGGRTTVPPVATIVAGLNSAGNAIGNYTLAINTTGGFTMGPNEKFTVLGSLAINAGGAATIGDISTLRDLSVNGSSIFVTRRAGADIFGSNLAGGVVLDDDFGVDIVCGGILTFSVAPDVAGSGFLPTFATPAAANISSTLNGFTQRAFGEVTLDLLLASGTALDLKSDGPSNTNFAEAIAGAAPRESQSGRVGSDTAVGRAQRDELAKLGVYARPLDRAELVDFLVGRAFYLDVPEKLSPQAEDFKVAVNRLPGDVVNMVLDTYRSIFAQQLFEPEAERPMRDPTRMAAVLTEAWTEYAAAAGENADPALLRAHLEATDAESEAAVFLDSLQVLFTQLQYLGLTPLELRIAKTQLAAAVPVQGLTAQQLETAVMGPNSTVGATP